MMTRRQHGFQLIPAIDVLGEEAVRLVQGSFDHVSLRAGDPESLARRFASAGVPLVHVVDLEAARSGRIRPELIAAIVDAARPAAVQAAGGIRSPADAERLLRAGAARVVVGTAAFATPGALAAYAQALSERLVVALDVRGGSVAVAAWQHDTGLGVEAAAERCAQAGAARILCTAIDRDGTLAGPDLDLLRRVVTHSALPVLASGGVATAADLAAVEEAGCEGVIVGRALLDGSLPLGALRAPDVGPDLRRYSSPFTSGELEPSTGGADDDPAG